MTRSISRISSLALAIAAVAAPTAAANPFGPGDAPGPVTISKVTPDARDAGRPTPPLDRVSPDARDKGRRETAPLVVTHSPVAVTDGFDWLDAAVGAAAFAAMLALAGGAAVRVRRSALRAS